jgi:hypothetical protein
VCPNAARQTRQPSAPRRPVEKTALNPPASPLRPVPEPTSRFPILNPFTRRHLAATRHESRNTPTGKQNDQSENCYMTAYNSSDITSNNGLLIGTFVVFQNLCFRSKISFALDLRATLL